MKFHVINRRGRKRTGSIKTKARNLLGSRNAARKVTIAPMECPTPITGKVSRLDRKRNKSSLKGFQSLISLGFEAGHNGRSNIPKTRYSLFKSSRRGL